MMGYHHYLRWRQGSPWSTFPTLPGTKRKRQLLNGQLVTTSHLWCPIPLPSVTRPIVGTPAPLRDRFKNMHGEGSQSETGEKWRKNKRTQDAPGVFEDVCLFFFLLLIFFLYFIFSLLCNACRICVVRYLGPDLTRIDGLFESPADSDGDAAALSHVLRRMKSVGGPTPTK